MTGKIKTTNLNIGLVPVRVDEADITSPEGGQADEADGDEHVELSNIAQDVRLLPVVQAGIGNSLLEKSVDDWEETEVEGEEG